MLRDKGAKNFTLGWNWRCLINSLILFDDSKKMTNLRLVIIFLDEVAQIIYLFPTDSPYNRLYH